MKNSFLKSNKTDLLFILLLLIVSLLYDYHNILTYRPYSIHQWRQTDCLSITMNYYKENRNFFEPAIHWVGEKDGKTVSECPLIYYSVAQLWKIFGYHEFIFRLLNILIVFSGLFCLYKLIYGLISDTFWSFIIPLLLFTSPILVYYSNNFLADAPAFGLSLIGCFFLWKGYAQQKKCWYYLSFVFFLLCGLIKISSLISFFAILLIHAYLVINSKKKEKCWFYKWYNLLPYFVVLFVIFLWYRFALDYNQKNISGIFLTGILPIWDIDISTRKNIWQSLQNDLVPAYFNKKALFVALSLFIALFIFYKKVNKWLFYLNVLVFLGIITYIILFFQAFTVHDYYLTNLLIFIPLPFITVLEMLKRSHPKIFNMSFIRAVALCGLLLLIYETSVINRMKYSTKDWLVKNNFVLSKETMDLWDWYHWNYSNHFKAYETITPYLRSIGIKRTDRIVSLPDESPNISLYLMDQKGFTGFGFDGIPFDQKMDIYQKYGAKFLVIDTSTSLYKQDYLKPYINHKIGNYKNISIFKLN